jgi:chemotaxis protein histidine kinase CheA
LNDRRAILVGKFRARSLDRLGRLCNILVAVEEARATSGELEELARELHTLKGESTMLGFRAMSEVLHGAEDRLSTSGSDPTARKMAAIAILGALETIARYLRGELGDDDDAQARLTEVRDELRVATRPEAPSDENRPGVPEIPNASASDKTVERNGGGQGTVGHAPAQRWVQVNAQRIDELCERISDFEGEFRALYFKLGAHSRGSSQEERRVRELRAVMADFDRGKMALEDIASSAWTLRLMPVEPALLELATYARNLATRQGKRVRTFVRGGDVQIERSLLDALGEPLLHIVRNAVDHGIESSPERSSKGEGHIQISAEAVGANILVTIADDGRGIDTNRLRATAVERGLLDAEAAAALQERDALELVFRHGFSTRAEVTDLSGRGVGLDIVRKSVESAGGTVAVTSEPGAGTRFSLTLPATISKEKHLVIEEAGGLLALPSRQVKEVLLLTEERVEAVAGGMVVAFDHEKIPLRPLPALIGSTETERNWAIVVELGRQHWAFTVSKLLGEFPLLRRPIDRIVGAMGLIGASATFEDGRLVLILTVPDLVRQAPARGHVRVASEDVAKVTRVLVVDDSAIVRDLIAEVLTHAGFEVLLAADGQEGLTKALEFLPDAILLDVDMPRMDGFEVLLQLRARLDVPIIMLTLRASTEDQRRAASLGATAYLIKSQFQESTLVDIVRRHTGRAR